jgi:hypothetical protein
VKTDAKTTPPNINLNILYQLENRNPYEGQDNWVIGDEIIIQYLRDKKSLYIKS